METLGSYLKQHRLKAGDTLDRIAAVTRIRASLLNDIENDRLERLPQGVFLRGFVKAYAEAIRMKPERALELLDQTIHQDFGAPPPTPGELETERTGSRFKPAYFVIILVALLAAVGACFMASESGPGQGTVSSAQTTDADIGNTGSFSPLKTDN
jgi:cytoskeletal protein RodZ